MRDQEVDSLTRSIDHITMSGRERSFKHARVVARLSGRKKFGFQLLVFVSSLSYHCILSSFRASSAARCLHRRLLGLIFALQPPLA